jgi:isopenicillin-N N-acyltransferase like protein
MAASGTATFPLVEVRGNRRELGRQHGEACRAQIRGYAARLAALLARDGSNQLPGVRQRCSPDELAQRALRFLPAFDRFAPHLVEEIRGIAEGADVPFATALLVNVRAEVGGLGTAVGGDGCTAFALRQPGADARQVLVGQNIDQTPEMEDLAVVLRVRPDDAPPAVMVTFGGLVGYPGLNADGVCFVQNQLANGRWRPGLPHYPLKRVLLEQRTLAGCLAAFDRAELASSGNYVLADGTGALLDVEATPDGYATLPPDAGAVIHTNHFRSPTFAPQERLLQRLPDSATRYERARGLCARSGGTASLATLQAWLRDHAGGPTAICRHDANAADQPMQTIWSVIAEPGRGLLHVARGNPCQGEYVAYPAA